MEKSEYMSLCMPLIVHLKKKKNDLISLPAKYLQEIADQQLRVESTWI